MFKHFKTILMKYFLLSLVALFFLNSCATKKEILYFQDSDEYNNTAINYMKPTLQPNDILKITVGALVEEAAIPYNRTTSKSGQNASVNLMQLEGYIVSEQNTINFPQLGVISTKDKNTRQLEEDLTKLLEDGGHLKNPTVIVRLLNAKVTILGEVKGPGTYNFTEESITLLQALGLAGDLTINGKREDILVVRETEGVYKTAHVDLTSAKLLTSPYYLLQPNDVVMVNANGPKVMTSGYLPNLGALLGVFSLVLTTVLLITR